MVAPRRQRKHHDPYWLLPRLEIIDEQGVLRPVREMHAEQLELLDVLLNNKKVIVLKPRQIGVTTLVLMYYFWVLLRARNPIGLLSVTHESGAMASVNSKLRLFQQGLPGLIRPTLRPDNARLLGLGHNRAQAAQMMAGGRGAGRSFTYQMLHATEMGFWPKGSAAAGGTDVDRTVWASVNATLHEGPYNKVVVESTGDGPAGIFYGLCDRARTSDEWAFVFFPWTRFTKYRMPVPRDWRRSEAEEELASEFGVTDEQLVWRRSKIVTMDGDERRFRREYPLTWMDPFLITDGMFFDVENLNRWAAGFDADADKIGLTIYHPREAGRTYYIGQDTAGGVGKDSGAIVVLRDDLVQVARWHSNTAKPHAQAEMAAQLSALYGRALVLCELNAFGKAVIERMEALGVNLWMENGRYFWTQRGRSLNTKEDIFAHAQPIVDNNWTTPSCPICVQQLMIMKVHDNGNIAAAGETQHDDLAMAYVLALWCAKGARRLGSKREKTVAAKRRAAHKRLKLKTRL